MLFSALAACAVGMIVLHVVTVGFDLERDKTMVLSWVALLSALSVGGYTLVKRRGEK
jgi:hypothetical protein